MRRAILLAALSLPALARAQTVGQITFTPDAFIGTAECDPANGTTVSLSWRVSATSSVAGGTYRVYASSRAPTADTNGLKLCETSDGTVDGTTVKAAQIGSDILATANPQSHSFLASDFVSAAGFTCQEAASRTINVCVHFSPSGQTTASDSATGALTLDLKAPAAPINVKVTPGEEALRASWDAGTGGSADTTYYKIEAKATDPALDAGTHTSGKFTDRSGRIGGLKNFVEYQVTVIAFSSADNASVPSAAVPGTPVPVEDFFEFYDASGGQEQGGCASGPAGALGILGAALALALRRRRQ